METADAGLHFYWFWGYSEEREKEIISNKELQGLEEKGKIRMKKKRLCPQPPEVLLSLAQMAKRPILLLLNPPGRGSSPLPAEPWSGAPSRLSSPLPNAQELKCPALLPCF